MQSRYNCWIHKNTWHSEHSHSSLMPTSMQLAKETVTWWYSAPPKLVISMYNLCNWSLQRFTAFYIAQAIKRCTYSVVCNITFASANQEVNLHIGLSQKGISYVLVEQLQRWYHRDSLLWLQVIRRENDIQKNCSSGTFQPRRSSSDTKVQEGGSLWSKCPFCTWQWLL